MRNIMGLESLVQRGRSPFYNDLVSLYQESLDAVNELPNPSHGDVTLTLKSVRFKERIKALVLTHMGINLEKVVVTESSTVNLMCLMEFTKGSIKRVTKSPMDATPGMMVEEINRLYNDKTGQYDGSGKKQDLPVQFSLFMATALWRVKDEKGNPFFTAEEVCAAIVHEFGHIDHFIRSALRIYGRAIDASEIVTYVQAHPDKDVIMALLSKVKKSKYIDKDFDTIIKVTEDYFSKSNSMNDPYYMEAITMLSAITIAEDSAYQLFMFNNLLGGGRDRIGSHTQSVDSERSADEFASRNGAYQYLVTMLGKVHSLSENKADLYLRQFLWSGPAVVFGLFTHFFSVFKLGPEEVINGYDPLMRRLDLIVETAKHAFHDSSLPDDVKPDIHRQIQEAEAYLAQYHSAKHRQIRAMFKQWKDNVSKLGRVVKSPFQNRLSQDYGRLQDATRSLSRHPLYYLADKR